MLEYTLKLWVTAAVILYACSFSYFYFFFTVSPSILPADIQFDKMISNTKICVCPLCPANIVKPTTSMKMKSHSEFHEKHSFVLRGDVYMMLIIFLILFTFPYILPFRFILYIMICFSSLQLKKISLYLKYQNLSYRNTNIIIL